jgi:hypothetical protein
LEEANILNDLWFISQNHNKEEKMKKSLLFLFLGIVISQFSLIGSSFAGQDPNDPVGPDSVFLRSTGFLVPEPPGVGKIAIPVYFRNDSSFIALQVPLTWTGPATIDSFSFFGSRIDYLFNKNVTIDSTNKKVLVTANVGAQQSIPEGRGMLVKFYFSTTDTGTLTIDTVANSPLPQEHLLFTKGGSITYTPQFLKGEFRLGSEQDPNDPTLPDSVSFYPSYAYWPLPSGPAKFYAHIRIANDDSVGAIILPLIWSGPVTYDSVTFRETIFPALQYRTVNPDLGASKVLIGAIPVSEPPIPPTWGLFATLCFTLDSNTGLVMVDSTFFPPINPLIFTTTEPEGFKPQFVVGDFPVLQYLPGDVNFDGKLDVIDIVYLVNYLYIDGTPPPHLITADMNGPDRVINVEDVVYLINYLYMHGPTPLPGDPW